MGTPQGREGPHLSRGDGGPPDQGHPPPPFKNKGSVSPREPWGQAGTPTPHGRWGPWGRWRHAQSPPPRAVGSPGEIGDCQSPGQVGTPRGRQGDKGHPPPFKVNWSVSPRDPWGQAGTSTPCDM